MSSPSEAHNAADTRQRLILTAERLFATCGIESVSLREIARASGQKNVAALQYHFGDREGLFSAILEYRMSRIEPRRKQLLQACDERGEGASLRPLVRCLVLPFVEHLRNESAGSHYIEFLARLQVSYPDFIAEDNSNRPWQANVLEISRRLQALVAAAQPEPAALQRQRMMGACLIHSVAEFERGLRGGRYRMSELESFADNLVDALCGMLAAPYG